ncbi:hypothetical protein B0H34DRAFT_737268 [Crassisporium funariophilum]|nr:hypothetical protein B0H34DRAFT_737268 [Crassisporium funariophilum]
MLGEKKNRLYIDFQHRNGKPGFHWSLVLGPKIEAADNELDCHLFHVTNTVLDKTDIMEDGYIPWRYIEKPVNNHRDRSLVGRILVAKLPAHLSVSEQALEINDILRGVAIVQRDSTWTCRVWAINALAALKATGGPYKTIPGLTAGGQLETEMIDIAESAKNGPTVLHKDMREK